MTTKTDLLIVESPNKIKSLQKYLPPHFEVASSVGHIRGINKKGVCIDIDNDFKPEYLPLEDKGKVIANLRKLAKNKTTVWIATDPDREGEGIGWHISQVLNLSKTREKRVTFSSITKKEVLDAIAKPRVLDMDMFYAYQARSVIDKLIGYGVSPLLHKNFNNYRLSGGRVQSVVLRLVIEREEEIRNFQASNIYNVKAIFTPKKSDLDTNKNQIETKLDKDIKDKPILDELLDIIQMKDTTYQIKSITCNETTRKPQPPYETMSLQQDASNKLGLTPKNAMRSAQNLFAAGLITYMRTDSTILAKEALDTAENYIKSKYGNKYSNKMQHSRKSKNSQEGHEACRPTDVTREHVNDVSSITQAEKRLYRMIWQRTIASQMVPAEIEINTIKINVVSSKFKKDPKHTFVGKAEKILFDGYLIIYNIKSSTNSNEKSDNEEESDEEANNDTGNDEESDNDDNKMISKKDDEKLIKLIKKLKEGDNVYLNSMEGQEKPTKPKNGRYTEATLIKMLKKLGIARPGTVVGMVTTVQDREYVVKRTVKPKEKEFKNYLFTYPDNFKESSKKLKVDGETNTLHPTPTGSMINEYLQSYFSNIINYEFTANMEKLLDEIANGKKVWHTVVKLVYDSYNPKIVELTLKIKETRKQNKELENSEGRPKYTNGIILLGKHPMLDVDVILMPKTKAGSAVCLNYDDAEKRSYANFSTKVDSMTLEKALKLDFYPKALGQYNNAEVYVKKRNNIYLSHTDKNYSIDIYNKCHPDSLVDEYNLDILDAIKIIKELSKGQESKKLSDEIEVKKGPFGYYIKYKGAANIPIPKKQRDNALTLTKDEASSIVDKHLQNERNKSKVEYSINKQAKANKPKKETKPKETKPKETKPKKSTTKKDDKEFTPVKIRFD